MPELTAKEYAELKSFVNRVLSWGDLNGPYGDGEIVTDTKALMTMKRVQKKLNSTIVISI